MPQPLWDQLVLLVPPALLEQPAHKEQLERLEQPVLKEHKAFKATQAPQAHKAQ
jgi:hypothetical protein